ncbi:NYN domain-containing protein [Salicibibacter halophilus]|uniref:NYN domain-containing protein n=1 Tax=Salicibibacter halophilus TaxID=2502791 RepID=A0A514LJQ8_9BACI|nr:NYN domain-containing protein [Salicibibacter halophilus]QDI91521.1 NYN domain-containing protein [Salicibibacter halophilus]
MKEIVLVDGYNIIGDWPELKKLKQYSLIEARDLLIGKMAEYQAVTGRRVIIVYDAHMVPGTGSKNKHHRVEVVYTRERETADERIEKLVSKLKNVETQVYVATSDYVEQSVTFGSGALRTSARELRIQMNDVEQHVAERVSRVKKENYYGNRVISKEVAEYFEKWRRNNQ